MHFRSWSTKWYQSNKKCKFNSNYKGPIQPLEHLNCFSNKSLKKLIMKYGFRPFNFKDILVLYFNKSIYLQIKDFSKRNF